MLVKGGGFLIMMRQILRALMGGFLLFLPMAAWAAEGEERSSSLVTFFWSALPFVLFFGLLYWVFRRQAKSPTVQRHQQFLARQEQHMERMESLLERLVVALERKDKDNA